MSIRFKYPYLEGELQRADFRLKAIVLETALFLGARGFDLTLTCLLRDRAAQEAIYQKALSIGAREPAVSPHEDGRAFDMSIKGIPDEAVGGLVDHLNRTFPYEGNPRFKTALRHDVGQGDHVHVQVAPAGASWARKPLA